MDEHKGENHYNCPIVAYYPETLKDNMLILKNTTFLDPFIDISNHKTFEKKFISYIKETFHINDKKLISNAITQAYAEYEAHMMDTRNKAKEMIEEARKQGKRIIVLAGRPYHIDPEVNHGIDKLIIKQNACVITEDSISDLIKPFPTNVLNQWTYHARLYAAAKYCTTQNDMDLVQLVSFGCGLDAITTDETREILQEGNKLYTQLKIDEITNLGAVNIRIRSLFAALKEREEEA